MKIEIKITIEDNETSKEKFIDKLTKRIKWYLKEHQIETENNI
jgi:hypothetical protein